MVQRARLLAGQCIVFLIALWGLHKLTVHDVPSELAKAGWPTPALTVGAAVLGIIIVQTLVGMAAGQAAAYLGVTRASGARTLLSVTLYAILALLIVSQTQVDLSGIALSGAVGGVVLGVAAQASLSNAVAGLVILFSRPYRSGQYVTVRAAAFAGSEYSGEVGEITLFYTTLFAGTVEIHVPNNSMMTSVVTLRPQSIEVYLPVLIPPDRWRGLSTTALTRRIREALPPNRTVSVLVERVEATQVQLGIRASLANEDEREAMERAVLRAVMPSDTAREAAGLDL
jgi:small conductance mechanosensitive channel